MELSLSGAHTLKGSTLHYAGDVAVGDKHNERKLQHTDVDLMYIRNQSLRWMLIDEVFMIPSDLLGLSAQHVADAAADSEYKYRDDTNTQPFGGYNVMMSGDTLRLPPIPASSALFLPPAVAECSPCGRDMLEMFWGDDENAIHSFVELTQQMRVEDEWYSAFLDQCRAGYLDDEMYNFIIGFPTEHCGSWMPLTGNGNSSNAGFASCRNPTCMNLHKTWRHMFEEGHNWQTMVSMECAECKSERERRNRWLVEKDPRLHNEPFLIAPYVHKNNDPKIPCDALTNC